MNITLSALLRAALVFSVVAAAGCVLGDPSNDGARNDSVEQTGTSESALYTVAERDWNPGRVVPICFHREQGTYNRDYEEPLFAALSQSWGKASGIVFLTAESCSNPSLGSPPYAEVYFDAQAVGHASTDITVNNGVYRYRVHLFPASMQTRANFFSDVAAEFGHVLGFTHEQTRPDNYKNGAYQCDTWDVGETITPGGTTLSSFDMESIMSYCRTGVYPMLSAKDESGVKLIYGSATANNSPFFALKPAYGSMGYLSRMKQTGEVAVRGIAWPSNVWQYLATGDFDGDKSPDQLWWNTLTNGAGLLRTAFGGSTIEPISIPINADWKVAGVGDFNADGRDDVAWFNPTGGVYASIWLMNTSGQPYSSTTFYNVGANWKLVGVGDFGGPTASGKPIHDLMWRNTSNGQNRIWFMNGLSVASTGDLPFQPTSWTAEAVGEVDSVYAGTTAEILWRNSSTGEVDIWFTNGLSIATPGHVVYSGSYAQIPSSFKVAYFKHINSWGVGYEPTLIWHNDTTRELRYWFLSTGTGSLIREERTTYSPVYDLKTKPWDRLDLSQ